MTSNFQILFILSQLFLILLAGCKNRKTDSSIKTNRTEMMKGTFGDDVEFLKKHYTQSLILKNESGEAQIVVVPELQGRVMTSTLKGDKGASFGWLNYDLIRSGVIKNQFNPVGGEERFWIGPEGGQFSYYFKPGSAFEFENWQVPAAIDREPFDLIEQDSEAVVFKKSIQAVNYSGMEFQMEIERKIELLDPSEIAQNLDLDRLPASVVAYRTQNSITNVGEESWSRETGMPSIWLLSMFTCSPDVTIVVPVREGSLTDRGPMVNDDYFGPVPSDRLKSTDKTIFFKADGRSRGKIGVSPLRAKTLMGSYDEKNKVLTLLQIGAINENDDYVNSAWELQNDPFSGDVLNSYNDGPLEDGSQMGPFYELESSSPALNLKPDSSQVHSQTIYHFSGTLKELNTLTMNTLNVSLEEIKAAF